MREAFVVETNSQGYGHEWIKAEVKGATNISPGLYLMVPIQNEVEGWKLAERLQSKSTSSQT